MFAGLISKSSVSHSFFSPTHLCISYHHHFIIHHSDHPLCSVLEERGVSPEHMIVFMYDDIANNPDNPFPGKIFNDYSHQDVYAGVKIDYRGDDITSTNVVKVLLGQHPGVGTDRVLNSTVNDRVYLYFADHGAFGGLLFPNDTDYLDSPTIIKTLNTLSQTGKFGKLVFYVEACEAGSNFYEATLPPHVYVVTASNTNMFSFAMLQDDSVDHLYLTNWVTNGWMNMTEYADPEGFVLQENYEFATSHTGNFSQPCQYGDLEMAKELNVNDLFGPKLPMEQQQKRSYSIPNNAAEDKPVPATEARYYTAKARAMKNPTEANLAKLHYEEHVRQVVDKALHNILHAAGLEKGLDDIVPPCYPCSEECDCLRYCGGYKDPLCRFQCCNIESCHRVNPAAKDGLICEEVLVRAWQKTCGFSHEYILTGEAALSRACRLNLGHKVNIAAALKAISTECPLKL